MKRHTKPPGRLLGGLLRIRGGIARRYRTSRFRAEPTDLVFAVIGGLIGAAVGWLFVAMWIR